MYRHKPHNNYQHQYQTDRYQTNKLNSEKIKILGFDI